MSAARKPAIELNSLPLQRFLTYRLIALTARLNRQASAVLAQVGEISLPEWRVMAFLGLHKRMNGASIADATGIDPALLSRTFRALERRGLIASSRSAADRRVVFFALTVEGQAVHDRTLPVMRARQQHLMDSLSPAELDAFFRITDKLELAAEARTFGGLER
jgi:DNA-binding MarR family transcriptional regulator